MDRHKDTIWWPVAGITVAAGSLTNWSKSQKWGKNLESTWNNTSKFLIWTKYYHHHTPAPTTPGSDLDCGQTQGYHAGDPSQRYQAPGNNNVTPLNCPSVSTPADTSSFPETPGIVSASPGNRWEMSHWYDQKKLQCRIESNQLSWTAVRGLFGTRLDRLFFSASSSEVGAPTSNSETDTCVRGNPGSVERTTGSPERSYIKIQQPHEVISMFQRAQHK